MAAARPTTITQYIAAAPAIARPHLHKLHEILASVAPDAQQVIKWGNPFFIEPRFLFAFSAHKAHMSFATTPETMAVFSAALREHETTTNFLKMPYAKPIPEDLIRRMAEYRVKVVSERTDDGFW